HSARHPTTRNSNPAQKSCGFLTRIMHTPVARPFVFCLSSADLRLWRDPFTGYITARQRDSARRQIHHCASMFASLTASAQALSASSNFCRYSSGVATHGVAPWSIRNVWVSAERVMSLVHLPSLSILGFGVPAGTQTPHSATISPVVAPVSSLSVGTSGSA